MKKRLISYPEEIDEKMIEVTDKLGFTVNALIVQILWEWANSLKGGEDNG